MAKHTLKNWMECQEENEEGDITAVEFDYHGNSKTFIGDSTIRTTVGRLKR